MVKPILTYGSEIYGIEFSDILEKVQIECCKYFLGVNKSVNDSIVLGECGRLPLCIEHHVKCVKYWCKLISMTEDRYPRNCYIMLKRHDEIGRTNWVTSVKNILYRYGFGLVWISQEIGNVELFLMSFNQLLIDCNTQNWLETLGNSSRCDI